MRTAIRLLLVGLVVLLAACVDESSLRAGGSEKDTSMFGRIGQVFRF